MDKRAMEFNIGGAAVVIEPAPDGKFDFKFEKMQKFEKTVKMIGIEKTAGRSVSDMNRNPSDNEITK